jgi:hypothetical protein
VLGAYRTVTGLRTTLTALGVESPATADPVSGELNSAGMRGAKEERMDELRLSLSRSSRTPVAGCRGELPFNMWDGMADGFGPSGGEPPGPMVSQGKERMRKWDGGTEDSK